MPLGTFSRAVPSRAWSGPPRPRCVSTARARGAVLRTVARCSSDPTVSSCPSRAATTGWRSRSVRSSRWASTSSRSRPSGSHASQMWRSTRTNETSWSRARTDCCDDTPSAGCARKRRSRRSGSGCARTPQGCGPRPAAYPLICSATAPRGHRPRRCAPLARCRCRGRRGWSGPAGGRASALRTRAQASSAVVIRRSGRAAPESHSSSRSSARVPRWRDACSRKASVVTEP